MGGGGGSQRGKVSFFCTFVFHEVGLFAVSRSSFRVKFGPPGTRSSHLMPALIDLGGFLPSTMGTA